MSRAGAEGQPDNDAGPALAALWWIGLPALVRRVSPSLFACLLDGVWIFAFRRLAMLATPVAAAVGLLIGARTVGYEVAIFESILLVAVIVAVGTLSAHLGLALITGLALGDFFLAGRDWALEQAPLFSLPGQSLGVFDEGLIGALARERVPLLIGYVLLAVVAVGIPPLIKSLLAQLPVPGSWPAPVQVALSVGGHAGLTYFLVSFWAQATPVLIRPMWTWQSNPLHVREVSLALVEPLQREASLLLVLAVAASLARMAIQWHLVLVKRRGMRISHLQERLRQSTAVLSTPGRIRRLWQLIWRTAVATLLLAGLLATWSEAAVLAGVLFVAGLVQMRLVPIPMGAWPATAARIPLLIRLVAAFIFISLLVQPLAERLVEPQAATFRTFLVMTVLAMLVFMVLLPAPPSKAQESKT